ncbi:hypothetical protein OQ471_21430, partial [Bacillus sp. KeR2]|uniref:hypothetical protein n=1 Tax=Bacillus sp. KeR2 TaxID=2994533 RepID=UPI00224AB6A4
LSARPKTPVRRKSAKGQPAILRMKKYDVFLFDGACTIVKKGVYLFNKRKTRSTEAGFPFSKMLFNCMF